MIPTVELPPVIPFTFQVTLVFDVFWTVAVKVLVRFVRTDALVGEMATVTAAGGGVIVTVPAPTAVLSAWLRACTVTVAGEGTVAGAVYSPDALMLPALAVQVTV